MRVSLEEAIRWVADFEASGMGRRALSDAHGLGYGCIARYRRRMLRAEKNPSVEPGFHELPVALMTAPAVHAACVVLPNGYRVEIMHDSIGAIDGGVAVLIQELALHHRLSGVS